MNTEVLEDFKPTAEDFSRYDSQCDRILAMLETGPVLRSDLTAVARNVTARISQLRKAGHNIVCKRINSEGETIYFLGTGDAL